MPELVAKNLDESRDESSDSSSSSESEYESEPASPLADNANIVELLPGAYNTLSAEAAHIDGPQEGELRAIATPPVELTGTLPKDYKPGYPVKCKGPHGPISLMPPPDAKPGSTHTFRLDVPPDMRVTVPKNKREGTPMIFQRNDGHMVQLDVPPGKGPGDSFLVAPPALMVKIPKEAKPGDVLVFKNEYALPQHRVLRHIEGVPEWLRIKLPDDVAGFAPDSFIGARLPFEVGQQADMKREC